MAITFSDLHTESGLKALDGYLAGQSYIFGDSITKDDVKVYAAISGKPGGPFPNSRKWYECVASQLAKSFPGKSVGVKIGGGAATSAEAAPAPVEEAAGDDDDDLDLFGDETEEDKKAAEEREATKKPAKKRVGSLPFFWMSSHGMMRPT